MAEAKSVAQNYGTYFRWFKVLNASGQAVPPRSVVKVSSSAGGVYRVIKPDGDEEAAYLVTDGQEIPVAAEGSATADLPVVVRYSTGGAAGSGSAPASSGSGGHDSCACDATGYDPAGPNDAEDNWGPAADSWALHRGGKGWVVLGGAHNCYVTATRTGAAGSESFGVKVIVTGSSFCPSEKWLVPCGGSGVATLLCGDGTNSGIPADRAGNAGCPSIDSSACPDLGADPGVRCPPLTNDPCKDDGGNITFCSYCVRLDGSCPEPYWVPNLILGPPYCLPSFIVVGPTYGHCVHCPTGSTLTIVETDGESIGLYCTWNSNPGSTPAGSGPDPCPPGSGSGAGAGHLVASNVGPACKADYYAGEIQKYDPRTGTYVSVERCWVQDMNGRALTTGERYGCWLDYPAVDIDGELRRLFSTDRGHGDRCGGCRQEFGSGSDSCSGGGVDHTCKCGWSWSETCRRCIPDNFDPSQTNCTPPAHPDRCGGCVTCQPGEIYLGDPCFFCTGPCYLSEPPGNPLAWHRCGCGCCPPGCSDPPSGYCCAPDGSIIYCACDPGFTWDPVSGTCVCPGGGAYVPTPGGHAGFDCLGAGGGH